MNNNQHDAPFIFSSLITTPLHVSGASAVHHQEEECIYVANGACRHLKKICPASFCETCHKLHRLVTEYGLTISAQKTKSMTFKGRDPVRTEIVIDNKIIEQVNSFNYLGNMISYERETDTEKK
jgi:hypothetical protein